jgi:WD40 repeat protein
MIRSSQIQLGGAPIQAEWSPDGAWIAITAVDRSKKAPAPWILSLIEMRTGRCARVVLPSKKALTSIAFSPDSTRLAGTLVTSVSNAPDGSNPDRERYTREGYTTRILQWKVGACRQTGLPLQEEGIASALAYRSGGRYLAVTVQSALAGDRILRDLDLRSGSAVSSLRILSSWAAFFGPERAFGFARDGTRLYRLTGFDDYTEIRSALWDMGENKAPDQAMPPWDVEIPDQFMLLWHPLHVKDNAEGLTAWDAATGQRIRLPQMPHGRATTVCFDRSSTRAAVTVARVDSESITMTWDTVTGRSTGDRLRTKGYVDTMMFASDGNLEVAVVRKNSILLWRLPKVLPSLHEMELRTWVMLGTRLNELGELERIGAEDWIDLRQELRELNEERRDLARR